MLFLNSLEFQFSSERTADTHTSDTSSVCTSLKPLRLIHSCSTHHFKVARCNNQVVDHIVDLCDQGQDGRLTDNEQGLCKWNETAGQFHYCWMSAGSRTDLLCRGGAQILVPFQQTLTESRLIRCRLHSGEGHLTLVTNNSLLEYLHCSFRTTLHFHYTLTAGWRLAAL